MKTILVTGGSGFVGSHLCARLLEIGHRVICLDNFYTSKRANVAPLENHPNFTLVEHDVCHPYTAQVDEIYNLACPASPPLYQKDPLITLRTSLLGALNMLELARTTGATILQASTSEVYGDPAVHPQPETYWGHVNPIGPRACYDEGKRCAETLFFEYHRTHNVPIKIARIFNTYGPHMDPNDGRVVSNLIVQALKNEPLTIYGKGEQTRSFCYVTDLIDGLIALMNSSHTGPINLGNPDEFTILELAHHILTLTASTSPLHFAPIPQDDPKLRRPDISAARTLLNWEPKVPLLEGLKSTIQYFSNNQRINLQ